MTDSHILSAYRDRLLQGKTPFGDDIRTVQSYQKGLLNFKKKMQTVDGEAKVAPLTHIVSTQLLKPKGAMEAKVNDPGQGGCFTEKLPDYAFDAESNNLRDNFDLIDARKVDLTKPVLIIYNPVSGKQKNIRQTIADALKSENIPFEFYESTGYRDAFGKA